MIVVPAIDLLDGKAVRLRGGRREAATIYHERPWEVAEKFVQDGATLVHVVDLDGAFAGERRHAEVIRRIGEVAPIQVGGGLRDASAISAALAAGARYVVLGTAAVASPDLVERLCVTHPGRIVVAVDAREGKVAIGGWTTTSTIDATELATRAVTWGAAKILYTDIARDGMRTGPAVDSTAALQRTVGDAIPVIASGGISALSDLRALTVAGVRECVVGRALYDGVFTLADAIAAC